MRKRCSDAAPAGAGGGPREGASNVAEQEQQRAQHVAEKGAGRGWGSLGGSSDQCSCWGRSSRQGSGQKPCQKQQRIAEKKGSGVGLVPGACSCSPPGPGLAAHGEAPEPRRFAVRRSQPHKPPHGCRVWGPGCSAPSWLLGVCSRAICFTPALINPQLWGSCWWQVPPSTVRALGTRARDGASSQGRDRTPPGCKGV